MQISHNQLNNIQPKFQPYLTIFNSNLADKLPKSNQQQYLIHSSWIPVSCRVSMLSCQCLVLILTNYIYPIYFQCFSDILNPYPIKFQDISKKIYNITLKFFRHILNISKNYPANISQIIHSMISLISISQLSHLYVTKITAISQIYLANKLNLILWISQ